MQNLKETKYFEDPGRDNGIVPQLFGGKWRRPCGLGSAGSAYGPVAGPCDPVMQPSSSVKGTQTRD